MITRSGFVDGSRKKAGFQARLSRIAALFLAAAAVIVISGCSLSGSGSIRLSVNVDDEEMTAKARVILKDIDRDNFLMGEGSELSKITVYYAYTDTAREELKKNLSTFPDGDPIIIPDDANDGSYQYEVTAEENTAFRNGTSDYWAKVLKFPLPEEAKGKRISFRLVLEGIDWNYSSSTPSLQTMYQSSAIFNYLPVVFDVNGRGTAPKNQYVETGYTLKQPDVPDADGWTVEGWYKEAACKNAWDFDDDIPESETVLYAKWTKLEASVPRIVKQPADLELTAGYKTGTISLTAEAPEGHTLHYQWYVNKTNSNEGGTAVAGAEAAEFTVPEGKAAGTEEYYYCVVTAGREDNGETKSVPSKTAVLKVVAEQESTTAPEKETKADPAKQMGKDGTALGKGASAEAAEAAILAMKTDEAPAGSKFRLLQLKSLKQTKTSVEISWKKVSGAKKYVVYGNQCGKKNKMKKLKTTSGNKQNFRKVAGKKVKKGTYYKFLVVALDKDNKVVSASVTIHAATKGGKVGNHKSVSVSKTVIKKAKSLKKGETLKLGAKTAVQSKKLKVKQHRGLKYEITDTKTATVSKNGVIKGKKKGSCYVYIYAQNGVSKKLKVIVK